MQLVNKMRYLCEEAQTSSPFNEIDTLFPKNDSWLVGVAGFDNHRRKYLTNKLVVSALLDPRNTLTPTDYTDEKSDFVEVTLLSVGV